MNSKLRSIIVSLVIAIILITALPTPVLGADTTTSAGADTTAITLNGAYTVDLIAGGGNVKSAKDVGDVCIWNDGTNLYVEFKITADKIGISGAQVQVATSLAGIPQSNGNPVPGQFLYKSGVLGYVNSYKFTIPLDPAWTPSTKLYIAAHADVGSPGITSLTDFQPTLPDTVHITVLGTPYEGGPSYIPDLCVSGGTCLDGHYNAWCVDALHPIYVNCNSLAYVYSSYETLPSSVTQAGIIAHPENLGAVNWIINQNFVTSGAYTYGEVQFAIWLLLINPDPEVLKQSPIVNQYLGEGWVANAVALYDCALTHNSYVPGCGEKLVLILVPTDGCGHICGQVCIIPICIPCIPGTSETAWASITTRNTAGGITALNYPFSGKNWATYVTYTTAGPV